MTLKYRKYKNYQEYLNHQSNKLDEIINNKQKYVKDFDKKVKKL